VDDTSVVVSEILNQTNSVLSDEDKTMDQVFVEKPLETNNNIEMASGTTLPQDTQDQRKLVSTNNQPTNKDIMDLLYNVSQRLTDVEKKLGSLKTLEKRVDGFDRELKKIWCAIEDRQKKIR